MGLQGCTVRQGNVTLLYPLTRAAERKHWGFQPDLAKKLFNSQKMGREKNYEGRGDSPYITLGIGDTLA
eukprot:871668-Pelagomonas_calceolata.AAC.1